MDYIKNNSIILSQFLLKQNAPDIEKLYQLLLNQSKTLQNLNITDLKYLDQYLLSRKKIKNIGIDLPIMLGSSNKPLLMIIALDPKRNKFSAQSDDDISIGSVFNLHAEEGKKAKNNYYRFIEPLLQNYSVYLTDVYKLYFESVDLNRIIVSNKIKTFTDFKIDIGDNELKNVHQIILEREINFLAPERIITMGVHAEKALKVILKKEHYDERYLFMPHISRTVTQHIPVVAKMLKSIGVLNNDNKLIEIGEAITKYKLFYNS